MKLPPLPPLRKKGATARPKSAPGASRKTTIGSKLSKAKSSTTGRDLPNLAEMMQADVPEYAKVERSPTGWGDKNWFETKNPNDEKAAVGGTCAVCGATVRATDLKLRRLKDGTEYWKCDWC